MLHAMIHFILQQYSGIYQINGNQYTTRRELKALIDNLFSRKWDTLFDDGVFYSCYALTYRDRKLRLAFRDLHDSLRGFLVKALRNARKNKVIAVKKEQEIAEIIFALLEGGYYYLGMSESKTDYARNMNTLKKQAYRLLGLE
jgi:hypothetical protein